MASNPSGGVRDVTVTSGQAATDAFFANYRPSSISDSVFDDFDGDGEKETGEAARANRTVYLDSNGDGDKDKGEPTALTNFQGNYTFGNLKPGIYAARTVPAAGEVVTGPPSDVQSVTLQSGLAATGRHLGVFKLGIINVDVREDKNGDGSVSSASVGDTSLPGWRVFLDLDRDRQFNQSNEPAVITVKATSQQQQNATFGSLFAGTYDVRIESQDGWVATTPVLGTVKIQSGVVSRVSIGEFQRGAIGGRVLEFTLRQPDNDPGKLPIDPNGLPGRVVFLDSNNNGRLDRGESSTTTDDDGHYQLTGVGPGPQHVRNVLPPGWIAKPTDAEQEITINSGVQYEVAKYSSSSKNGVLSPGSYFLNKRIGAVTGRVVRPAQFGLAVAGAVVYFDVDNDGVQGAGENAAVTDDRGDFVLTRPIHDGLDSKAQPFTLRLQIPLGFQMDNDPSFRVIEVPFRANSLDVFEFQVSEFHLIPQQPFEFFQDTFDRPASSILGDDWREVAGNLSISSSSPSGPGLQGNGTSTDSIAIVNSLPVANVELNADVATILGVLNSGLVARYQEATGDMYVGRLVRREGQTFAEIRKIVAGQSTVLASVPISGNIGSLAFIVTGDQLTLNLGSQSLTASDGAISSPGQVGVILGDRSLLGRFSASVR